MQGGGVSIMDVRILNRYDAKMRTTLTIDDDVAAAIEERRRAGEPLKRVINALLREGLQAGGQASRPRKYRTKPHKLRMRAGFDPVRLNQLVDELEMDIAAYAGERGATVYSNDRDYGRFEGLRWKNPLA